MTKERWEGGYIRYDSLSRPTYIIERKIHGKRYHVSTQTHSIRPALIHLARFEANPNGYKPEGEVGEPERKPLWMTKELVLKYVSWSRDVKGNTGKHAKEQGNRLGDWAEDLAGVDLRKATAVGHLKPALDKRQTCRQHRIIAIKAFYSWLRKEEGLVVSAEDPTRDLAVPQTVPEKHRRRKAQLFEDVKQVRPLLEPDYRDVLDLLSATAWHVTELERFVRNPESGIDYRKKGTTIATLFVMHKIGEMVYTPITRQEHLAAAERLRERGKVPRRLNDALKVACIQAGVKPFGFGKMRHTVLTWKHDDGATVEEAADFAHHKDKSTTQRFYVDVEVPTVITPARLLTDD